MVRPGINALEKMYVLTSPKTFRNNPIPDGHSNWSMFEKLWEQNQLAMKNALEALKVAAKTAGNGVHTSG